MLSKLMEALDLKEAVDQEKSEAVITLTTLLYQADGKVKLQEQDLFDKLIAELPWNNNFVSKEAFHREKVATSLDALAANQLNDYLASIVPALKSDSKVLALLRELAISDGDLDPREADILKAVANLMV